MILQAEDAQAGRTSKSKKDVGEAGKQKPNAERLTFGVTGEVVEPDLHTDRHPVRGFVEASNNPKTYQTFNIT